MVSNLYFQSEVAKWYTVDNSKKWNVADNFDLLKFRERGVDGTVGFRRFWSKETDKDQRRNGADTVVLKFSFKDCSDALIPSIRLGLHFHQKKKKRLGLHVNAT